MKKPRRCGRCRELYPAKELTRWLDEAGLLSPEYCGDCYDFILLNWEEGMDIESEGWNS